MSRPGYFSEYLVEKGIVTADAMVEALMEKTKSQPTICEIIFSKSLLAATDILRALSCQSRDHCDFVTACKTLGLWKSEFETTINEQIGSTEMSISEILVNNNVVSADALTGVLDSYLAECTSTSEAAATPPVSSPGPTTPPAPSQPAATLEKSEPSPLVLNYCELLNDGVRSAFADIIAKASSGVPHDLTDAATAAADHALRLAGAARVAGLEAHSSFFSATEAALRALGKNGLEPKDLARALELGTATAWDGARALESGATFQTQPLLEAQALLQPIRKEAA